MGCERRTDHETGSGRDEMLKRYLWALRAISGELPDWIEGLTKRCRMK